MSQAKHTPGPWVATSKAIVSGRTNIMHRPKWWHEGLFEDEDNANARLIAAAPTMYSYIETKALNGDDEAKQILEAIHASR